MQPSGWKAQYSVSVEALDDQHREIVEVLDELTTLVNQKEEGGQFKTLLDDLLDKIKNHFESEEILLKDNHYPSFTFHKTVHDAFLRQLTNRHKNWTERTEPLSIEGISLLRRWFLDHILGADKLYAAFLNHKGIS